MENNIIVSEAYSDVRAMARNVMRSKWLGSALALLIYTFVCSNLPNMLGDMIPAFKRTIYLDFIDRYYEYSTFPGLYSIFIEAAFSLGLAMFILNFIRAGKISIELIFGGFEKFIKAFLMNLVMLRRITWWIAFLRILICLLIQCLTYTSHVIHLLL